MKQCSKCHQLKEKDQYHRDGRSKDGLFAFCKQCSWETTRNWREKNKDKAIKNRQNYYLNHKETLAAKRTSRKLKNPEYSKKQARDWSRKTLLKKYGLTPENFEEMLVKQSRRCAICERLFNKRINIDHCHKTGATRGLLCTGCNTALGHIEKENFLEQATKYLSLYIKNF